MVWIEVEHIVLCPGRVANIDACDSAGNKDSLYLLPCLVEVAMHRVVGFCGFLSEEIMPDTHHRVRWRRDDQMHGAIGYFFHATAVTDYDVVISVRRSQLSVTRYIQNYLMS